MSGLRMWTCACGCSHQPFARACNHCHDRRDSPAGTLLCGATSGHHAHPDRCVLRVGHAGVHQDWVGGCWAHDTPVQP